MGGGGACGILYARYKSTKIPQITLKIKKIPEMFWKIGSWFNTQKWLKYTVHPVLITATCRIPKPPWSALFIGSHSSCTSVSFYSVLMALVESYHSIAYGLLPVLLVYSFRHGLFHVTTVFKCRKVKYKPWCKQTQFEFYLLTLPRPSYAGSLNICLTKKRKSLL